jgi:deoxyribonuclease IV
MRIGFHVSTEGGWGKALARAVERRCEALQIFVGAPVQWKAPRPSAEDTEAWTAGLQARDIRPLFVHACYLINLASLSAALRRKSARRLAADLTHAGLMGAAGAVVHLGSPGGSCYGQIGGIIGQSRYPERLSVCLDSAHSFAAGYAWHQQDGLDAALAEAEAAFGLARLELLHINDSRADFGSHVDRHWHIGKGKIGAKGFRVIVNHPRLRGLPMIMETPEATLEADLRNLWALRRCVLPEHRPPARHG